MLISRSSDGVLVARLHGSDDPRVREGAGVTLFWTPGPLRLPGIMSTKRAPLAVAVVVRRYSAISRDVPRSAGPERAFLLGAATRFHDDTWRAWKR